MAARRLSFAGLAVLLALAAPAAAEVASLQWDDLLPAPYGAAEREAAALQARLDAAPAAEQEAFRKIGAQRMLRRRIAEGMLKAEELMPDNQALLRTDFDAQFPAAAAIVDEVERLNARFDALDKTPNAALDGKTVRMPGYVLPLEFAGPDIVEFLLVPFVGACIHAPPPPPNQMLHVRYPAGFESPGLYAPVYVTGRLSAVGATLDLFLTDGQSSVEAGYRLEAIAVEPYEE